MVDGSNLMRKMNPDKKWNLFNKDIQKYIAENNFYLLGSTYYEMAGFLKSEKKDDRKLRDLGYKMKAKVISEHLMNYRNLDVSSLEIIATENSCPECKDLNGKIIPFKEALISSPLPSRNCSFPCGCRCVYGPTV